MSLNPVILHLAAIDSVGYHPATKVVLQKLGEKVAERAASAAPKASGDGARSIRAESSTDAKSAVVKVSWDKDHYYMLYHEIGTSQKPARPFLRPALDGTYTL